MSVDFTRAWQIARMSTIADHDEKCSYRQTNGGIICDCPVLTQHPEYLDSILQGKDGEPCLPNKSLNADLANSAG